NPPIRQEPQQPQPIEEPPRPLPVPPVERPPLPMQASNSTYINAENAATGLGECEWPPHRQGVSTGGTYARRRQSTTWSKSATKQRPRNGAFTALEPRAANRSKNRFAKSGARVRVGCQSSEPGRRHHPHFSTLRPAPLVPNLTHLPAGNAVCSQSVL